MPTLRVRLDFTVSKSPLVPFNSTICPRNNPKRHQKAPNFAQCAPTPRTQARSVSWVTWLNSKFRGHLVHPQPPTFCGSHPSELPNEPPRPPYQWSLGGARGQPGLRTVGANGASTRNKRLLYSASSCGIWRSQHGHFIFKAFSNNCRSNTGVRVDHQHATNDFCIAPRLAESGAHSMNGLMTMDGLLKEPCAQVQHATNDFCIAPRLAESSAHSMDTSFSRQFPIIAGPTRVWEWIISTQQTSFV